ncbi:Phospholipase_D-nuclease N-terminal [Alkalibacterium subtropicum]|uniref:Phospholipase_D-nuclease N-terminal n=1 Tax=Alkalibacterium subtropicum TaxID=753702 RepID=A0A1I1FHU8_9LACT|nr:PLD nuclease N-terminal domain-containing protein [Alkalibacterium subtropicum]SFB98861.1 Phospholipase_D-nuclease N-terminal [Alkalibacterium subtropicum]
MLIEIMDYLPIIIPLLLLQLVLMTTALLHLVKNESLDKNNKIVWALVIIFVNTIGPILYLVFGRKED